MLPEFIDSGATFSDDRSYRYSLWRWWGVGNGQKCCFVMLNPSTADENVLDPTVTRCVGFARDWGFSGIVVANIFALRSTNPKELYKSADPVGPRNDEAITGAALQAARVVCAWGTHGAYRDRGEAVRRLLADFEPKCFGLTGGGHPKHPLYLRRDTELVPLNRGALVA